MTVPETHNFLIETGYVSSNCSDIGIKIGGAHMAELRRTKAGPFNEKTKVTLQDLADAYHYYTEGDETEIRKIIQPIETAISHIPKIWIMPTAITGITNGIDLKIPGIAKLETGIEPDQTIAIMTPTNELLALGIAKMNSNKMIEATKGIAVRIKKVLK